MVDTLKVVHSRSIHSTMRVVTNQILTMGKVVFLDPIDHISGKIAKKFRAIYKFAKATGLKFTSISGERTTPVLAEELARRARFASVAAAVAAHKKDLSKVTTDTKNFLAQRNEPNGKKTMKSYLWSLELAAYDARP